MVNNRIISSMKSVFSSETTTIEEQQQQDHQIELPSSSATVATGDFNDFDNNDDI